jgi:hypothetical protein
VKAEISRITWLKLGDQITRYFHRKATWWAKKNNIRSNKKEDGQVVEEPSEMEKVANE